MFVGIVMNMKEHANITTVGHVDHGKTTLTAAISRVANEKYGSKSLSYEQIDSTPDEQKRKITINTSHVELLTSRYHLTLADSPGHQDYIKNMLTGITDVQLAVLVISAVEGVKIQTREHVRLIKQSGIPKVVVFMNKMDDPTTDEDTATLVQDEVLELLSSYGYEEVTVIKGSALDVLNNGPQSKYYSSIVDLIETIDRQIPPKENEDLQPFRMWVKKVYQVKGIGSVATGIVNRGTLKLQEQVECVGMGSGKHKGNVIGLEMYHQKLDKVQTRDDCGILVKGLKDYLVKGCVLCIPGSLDSSIKNSFKAEIYIPTKEEDGRDSGFKSGYQPQCFIQSAEFHVTLNLIDDEFVAPGDHCQVEVLSEKPVVVESGMLVKFRDSKQTVALGKVID